MEEVHSDITPVVVLMMVSFDSSDPPTTERMVREVVLARESTGLLTFPLKIPVSTNPLQDFRKKFEELCEAQKCPDIASEIDWENRCKPLFCHDLPPEIDGAYFIVISQETMEKINASRLRDKDFIILHEVPARNICVEGEEAMSANPGIPLLYMNRGEHGVFKFIHEWLCGSKQSFT